MPNALLIIDMQNFVVDRMQRGIRYHPQNCIENMLSILEEFRKAGRPILHVRHNSREDDALLHEDSPYSRPVRSFEELSNEPVFIKSTSSAFSSSDLLSHLQKNDISSLVVIGAVAGFCVSSTVRMGADLGFDMTVVKDAVVSFELENQQIDAKAILDVTLALLASDFARVIATSELQIGR